MRAVDAARRRVASGGCQLDQHFLKQLDHVCATTNTAFNQARGGVPDGFDPEHPRAGQLPKVGAYFAQLLPARQAFAAKVETLGKPRTGVTLWRQTRKLALEANTVAMQQTRAAQAGDSKEFVATVHQLKDLVPKLRDTAGKAGISSDSVCMKVF